MYFQQQGQIAARARFSHGGMGNLNAMEPTHALVQTLSQNQDPKFQVSLHGNVSNIRGIFFRTNQEGYIYLCILDCAKGTSFLAPTTLMFFLVTEFEVFTICVEDEPRGTYSG